jgi:hypothetical protein
MPSPLHGPGARRRFRRRDLPVRRLANLCCMVQGLDDALNAVNSLLTGSRSCALRHLRWLSATLYATDVLGFASATLGSRCSPAHAVGGPCRFVHTRRRQPRATVPAGPLVLGCCRACSGSDRAGLGEPTENGSVYRLPICLFFRRRLRPRPQCLDWTCRTWTPCSRTSLTPPPK